MKEKVTALYRITLLAALALTPALSYAQAASEQNANRLVVHLSHPSQPARVTLQMLAGSISVEGYTGRRGRTHRRRRRASGSARHEAAQPPRRCERG